MGTNPTPQELEVLQSVVRHGGRGAARELFISYSAVRKRLESLRRKTGCHSQAQLTLLAVREGYLTLSPSLARAVPESGAKGGAVEARLDDPGGSPEEPPGETVGEEEPVSTQSTQDPLAAEARLEPAPEAPPPLITVVILARNEEAKIGDAIRSVRKWCEILVLDDGSTDRTPEIARELGAGVLDVSDHPPGALDGLRNRALPHVRTPWVLVLDADERVPPALAEVIQPLVTEHGEEFEAAVLPFRHFFCGKCMEHSGWGNGGYTRPQLLKKGCFTYNERLHSGVQVRGRQITVDPDPERSIVHLSYDDLHQYLEKLNRYTDGEAQALLEDGGSHAWQAHLAHFVHDWRQYYEVNEGNRDGMHGFELAFLSAFYRFASRAKLWDLRRRRGEASAHEPVPHDLREMLEFMAHVAQHGPGPWLQACPLNVGSPPAAVDTPTSHEPRAHELTSHEPTSHEPTSHDPTILWHAPIFHASGYGDEARQFVFGLIEAGEPVSILPADWGPDDPGLPEEVRETLQAHVIPPTALPGQPLVFVNHTLPALQEPLSIGLHPGIPDPRSPSPCLSVSVVSNIARTMFETDRLPPEYVERLNRFDRIWVPSEFNRRTFAESGVLPDKIAVIPAALDAARFAAEVEPWPLPFPPPPILISHFSTLNSQSQSPTPPSPILDPRSHDPTIPRSTVPPSTHPHLPFTTDDNPQSAIRNPQSFTFLSIFDWSPHKGWDVLLEAFALEFGLPDAQEGLHPSAQLLIKTWSSCGRSIAEIRQEADYFLRARVGRGLDDFPNITLWEEHVPEADLPRLYRAADCFVLPTRGEGWCRPLMEAMAAGLPTLATGWSGLTAFHDAAVGYPVAYRLLEVPEAAARRLPLFAGSRWAEPDREDLRRLMRRVIDQPEEARSMGRSARERIRTDYNRATVTRLVLQELALYAPRRHRGTEKSDAVAQSAAGATQSRGLLPVPEPAVPQSPLRVASVSPRLRGELFGNLGRRLRVVWEGSQALLSSLARVNREFCLQLLAAGDFELSLREPRLPWGDSGFPLDPGLRALLNRRLSGPPDVTVRHFFPPDWRRPAHGKLVVMQPWEYGTLPAAWVEGAKQADEVWAYSRFVRDIYVRSGVPAEKVRVVPLGFDPAVFHPTASPAHLSRMTRLLFVGGLLERKGADLLLEAFRLAFQFGDFASLTVKDMGTSTFYPDNPLSAVFRAAAASFGWGKPHEQEHPVPTIPTWGPAIQYLDADLTDPDLAGLYGMVSSLVLPYRGEGFALPPLEAMACGVMPIVTAGGPTDDYLDDTVALRLPARRKRLENPRLGAPELGLECVGEPWLLEPDLDALVAALRWVHEHPEEVRRRGVLAAQRAQAWTWSAAAEIARERLTELVCPVCAEPGEVRLWVPAAA